ncbi:MFS general substrate transporter [Aureobasidium sp. EXF-12298]|nr:MFS general substrate transporter [Aureobasidium sp. EXF-12298]KAI4759892.1 MFS general substrate transporter [Aureobasidium sp. EXF-12344]KAI4779591.1 MFS general substrate transporter [Aureobasidium sp. EXF-3400]
MATTTETIELHQREIVDVPKDDRSDTAIVGSQQTWKVPSINKYRVPVTFWSLAVTGMNDASYGPLLPYLETYYDLSYLIVSLVFLSPFVGYTLSALINNSIHMKFGQRGVAIIAPTAHLIAYIVICLHPPYPVLVVAFILAGFGNGLVDSAWNAWIGAMQNANEILGLLHGAYGAGATIAPLIATSMISKAGLPWYSWYYVMIGAATIELATSVHAFWAANGTAYRSATSGEENTKIGLSQVTMKMPAARITWLCAAFLLCYVGSEVALGGWIVQFMIKVRNGNDFASGMVSVGFWLGITLGRIVLGFVTPRIGEKLAVSIYLPIAMGLELLFWLVPSFYVSAIAVSFQGFFLGPMFPAIIVVTTKLLPKHLHVPAVGFAAAFGGSGGALFPFAIGALAQAKGVQVLQPIILALFGMQLVLWLCLPRIGRKKD